MFLNQITLLFVSKSLFLFLYYYCSFNTSNEKYLRLITDTVASKYSFNHFKKFDFGCGCVLEIECYEKKFLPIHEAKSFLEGSVVVDYDI